MLSRRLIIPWSLSQIPLSGAEARFLEDVQMKETIIHRDIHALERFGHPPAYLARVREMEIEGDNQSANPPYIFKPSVDTSCKVCSVPPLVLHSL